MIRHLSIAGLCAAVLATTGRSAFAVTDSWLNPVDGSWPEAAKWSAGTPNDGAGGANYDVNVSAIGPAYTVGLYSNVSINSLTINSANATVYLVYADLDLNGGNLTVGAGTFAFANSALHNANIHLATSSSFTNGQGSYYDTFDNITLSSDINLPYTTVVNGLTLSNITCNGGGLAFSGNNQTLGGHGTLINTNVSGTALVIGSGIAVQTRGNITMSFADNQGNVVMNGNMTLEGDWSNEGTITLANNSIIHLQGNHTVSSLGSIINAGATTYLDGTLNNANGNFDFASIGVSTITGTVNGGTFYSSANAGLFLQNASLDGTTLACNASSYGLHLLNNFSLSNCSIGILNTLNIPGNQTISGNGNMTFNAPANSYGGSLGIIAGNLTLGPGITLTSIGSVNGGETFWIDGDSLINQGTINVSNGAVTLQIATTTWANHGTLSVSNGTLSLLGTFQTANLGNIIHTGGSLQLNGTLDNTGATFSLNSAGGWTSYGGTIKGGTVVCGGGTLTGSNLTLSGVTLQGDFSGSGLQAFTATNNLTLDAATLPITGTLVIAGNETLGGSGTIKFQYANFTSAGIGGAYVALTIAPGVTVESDTSGGTIGNQYYPYAITNQGTIFSTLSGAAINIYGTLTNQGNITYSNGFLNISTLINSGSVSASNATVTITGMLTNTGNIALGNSTLDIQYNPADSPGNFSHSGPTVLVGNVSNLSSPLDVANTLFGPVSLGDRSVFSNLTLVSSNGPIQVASNVGVTLNVTLGSDLVIPQSSTVTGNLTLQNANITLAGSSTLAAVLYTNSILGNGSIVFGGVPFSSPVLNLSSNSTLTLGSGITVRGDTEGGILYASSGIFNSGTINPNGQTLWVRSNLTNYGNITASSGCVLLQANLTNSGTINISGNGAIILSNIASPTGTLNRTGGIVATNASISSTTTDLGATAWGQVDLDAATLNSLTLKSSAGAISVYNLFSASPTVYPTTSTTFSNVTLASNLTIQPSATLVVNGTFNLSNATMHLAGGGASKPATLAFNSSTLFTGTGSIILDGSDSISNIITNSPSIPIGVTLSTGTGGGVLSGLGMSVGGAISATTPGTAISIQTSSVTISHNATLQASNGATISILKSVNNSGTMMIGTGSAITITGKLTENSNATLSGSGSLNVTNVAGTLAIPNTVNVTGTTLNALTSLTVAGSTDQWTGKLNIGAADMLVHTVSGGVATALNQLHEGYDNGDWAGAGGIVSSLAASMPAPGHMGIALMTGADYLAATGSPTFDGAAYSPSYILLKLAIVGDANLDGKVDLTDLNTVLNNLGQPTSSWTAGNFDYAPTVDLTDLNDVLNALGYTTASLTTSASLLPTQSAPEPTSLAFVALATPLFLTRRRRSAH